MAERDKFFYCLSFLRREYAGRLDDLKILAREVFATATEEVALTTVTAEGGSGGGQIKFDKAILGSAIEIVTAEMSDPLSVVNGRAVVFSNFAGSHIRT